MKTASAALISLLNSNTQFLMADLYTFTLLNGTVLRYTSADIDLTVGGSAFSSSGPRFKRGLTRTVIGAEVDTFEFTVYAGTNDLVNGASFLQALHNGAFDGASVKLDRVFMPSWGDTSAGALTLFQGRISDISEFGRTEAKVTVKSDLELLNIKMPRNLYQPGCLHTLYDAGCALLKNNFIYNSTAAAGPTKSRINCGLGQAAAFFDRGTITFTGGVDSGITRTVKSYSPGVFTLSLPLPAAPGAGDAFSAWPGCDKQQSTCSGKFNNLANFRGMPYIPVPETAI